MKEILIICAMDEEIARYQEKFAFTDHEVSKNFHYFEGTYGNLHLRLAKSGIGKVQMALTVSYLISQKKPDLVINTGSAGAINPEIKRFDCVVATGAFYHDVDMTKFGFALGQLQDHDLVYKSDTALTDQLSKINEKLYGSHAKKGVIATGDTFVGTDEIKNRIFTNFPDTLCAEMEGASLAQVCQEFQIPFGEIRSISDDTPDDSADQFDQAIDEVGIMAANVAIEYFETIK
ncbi:5'-methylthioadenosine/adenosylhomocysteine nucleosidase [Xylocopilactobacillus apicola]|uniref:adenosylhomocysteine nucleosidase n=1 Tax=Xylocopilactobacillus apicola TaxID=2932184 RepID=A0AAU9D0L9_9LACO|nr:5'-methylthioadenosine/adenosylhomocysteine nucleosidase [Xylocopilactobacillus apicola]BDR58236.1 5'-methylthioadenosine/S-adenosylhomocysteine nucleosidase [Xylocopilactobacillus apicola]